MTREVTRYTIARVAELRSNPGSYGFGLYELAAGVDALQSAEQELGTNISLMNFRDDVTKEEAERAVEAMNRAARAKLRSDPELAQEAKRVGFDIDD